MVGFRNTVGSDALNNWQTGLNQQIAFGRGSSGFVVINNEDGAWPRTFTTSLPDGNYCDVYAGPMTSSGCAGDTYTVSTGSFNASIPGRTAMALHIGALAASTEDIQDILPVKRNYNAHKLRQRKSKILLSTVELY
jgi:hypothetical protein